MSTLKHLFSTFKVKKMELANRVVMPPMGTNLGNSDATVSEALLAYMKRQAKGGAGLREGGCRFLFNTTVESIQEDSVSVISEGGKETVLPVDQVVLAVGIKPRDDLNKTLQERGIRHYIVGDASQVRRIIEATEEGARAAWDI